VIANARAPNMTEPAAIEKAENPARAAESQLDFHAGAGKSHEITLIWNRLTFRR
jgi:hypothetical protein